MQSVLPKHRLTFDAVVVVAFVVAVPDALRLAAAPPEPVPTLVGLSPGPDRRPVMATVSSTVVDDELDDEEIVVLSDVVVSWLGSIDGSRRAFLW